MKINKITVRNDGYIHCKSNFYSAHDCLNNSQNYIFNKGINKMYGEIDSGIWAMSYLLSMYNRNSKDFILFNNPEVCVNDKRMFIEDFLEYSCYMDTSYDLFSKSKSVRKLIEKGIRRSNLDYSPDDIRDLFCIKHVCFDNSLNASGNEIFKCMAAIAYSYGKQVFCFPWLSYMRYEGFHDNIKWLIKMLENLDRIVILPLGKE